LTYKSVKFIIKEEEQIKLEDFEMKKMIGSGGFGKVFLVQRK